MLVDKYI